MRVSIVPTAHGALYWIESETVKPSAIVLNRRCKLAADDCINAKGEFTGNWNPAPYSCFAACEPDDAAGVIRVAVSFKSQEQAETFLREELVGRTFDELAHEAKAQWDGLLSRVRIEGVDETERRRFYSHLMHALVQPRDRTDDGIGWDDHYTLWDTWRTLYPLLTLIDPETVAGVVNSFGERFARTGCCETAYTSGKEYKTGQGGDEADVVIADAVAKGVPALDAKKLVPLLESRWDGRTRGYRERGFVAVGEREDYCRRFKSGSGTMSFAWEDWCVGTALNGLGANGSRFLSRSANWTNIWDKTCTDEQTGVCGFVRARNSDGTFCPTAPRDGFNTDFYEANCWEYSFFVPHDIPGLIRLSGGRDAFLRRLELAFENGVVAFDNEPSFQIPWLFDYVGRRDLACKWAYEMRRRFTSDGCPGDDDSGAMGALYIFLTAGFFPLAGSDLYALHSPMATRVVFCTKEGGREFVVEAPGWRPGLLMTGPVWLNGVKLIKPFIHHRDIIRGGVLRFEGLTR